MTRPPTRPTPIRAVPQTSDQATVVAIVRALSEPPRVAVPTAFARAVAARAFAEPVRSPARWLGWGPRLALGSAALLTLGLFALAPHTAPSLANFRFDAELIFLGELSGLLLFAHRLLPRD